MIFWKFYKILWFLCSNTWFADRSGIVRGSLFLISLDESFNLPCFLYQCSIRFNFCWSSFSFDPSSETIQLEKSFILLSLSWYAFVSTRWHAKTIIPGAIRFIWRIFNRGSRCSHGQFWIHKGRVKRSLNAEMLLEWFLTQKKSVFQKTFTKLGNTELKVIYPALNTKKFEKQIMESDRITLPKEKLIITSINRYERKKGIAVGLKAIKLLKNQYGGNFGT